MAGLLAVGGLSLLLVLPVLVDAMQVYVEGRSTPVVVHTANPEGDVVSNYFQFPLSSFPYLIGASPWFLWVTVAAFVVGLIRRSKLVLGSLFWLICLFGLGYAYLLGLRLLNLTNLGAVLIMLYLPIGIVIGVAVTEIMRAVRNHRLVAYGFSVLFLLAGILAAPARATTIEAYRYFVTPADVAAMEWINTHTEPDALFAVNTYFWLPGAPHGTDAGYWIPYFTGRSTTASVMIFSLAENAYQTEVIVTSDQVVQLETDSSVIVRLAEIGVDYIFVGQKGNFASPGLNADVLSIQSGLESVYVGNGTTIFRLSSLP
jgi:hypothetical protein